MHLKISELKNFSHYNYTYTRDTDFMYNHITYHICLIYASYVCIGRKHTTTTHYNYIILWKTNTNF